MTERDEMIEKAIEYENTIYLNDRRDRHELMADFALSVRPKRLTVADMRELDKKVASGKISYSRMVELINEHFGLSEFKPPVSVKNTERIPGIDELQREAFKAGLIRFAKFYSWDLKDEGNLEILKKLEKGFEQWKEKQQ